MLVVDLDKAVQDDNEKVDQMDQAAKKDVSKKDVSKKDVPNHAEIATVEQIDDGANALTETMKRETDLRHRKVRSLISDF